MLGASREVVIFVRCGSGIIFVGRCAVYRKEMGQGCMCCFRAAERVPGTVRKWTGWYMLFLCCRGGAWKCCEMGPVVMYSLPVLRADEAFVPSQAGYERSYILRRSKSRTASSLALFVGVVLVVENKERVGGLFFVCARFVVGFEDLSAAAKIVNCFHSATLESVCFRGSR